jgi:hypothetical protein
LAVSPVLLGKGELFFGGLDLPKLGYVPCTTAPERVHFTSSSEEGNGQQRRSASALCGHFRTSYAKKERVHGNRAGKHRKGIQRYKIIGLSGAGDRSRTYTALRPEDFESSASAIPPLRHRRRISHRQNPEKVTPPHPHYHGTQHSLEPLPQKCNFRRCCVRKL